MDTKKAYKEIDSKHRQTLVKHGLAYCLRKEKNLLIWRVQIGKFNAITDPYLQAEISGYESKPIEKQFNELLEEAVNDKTINYN